jgi:hypothetical protein
VLSDVLIVLLSMFLMPKVLVTNRYWIQYLKKLPKWHQFSSFFLHHPLVIHSKRHVICILCSVMSSLAMGKLLVGQRYCWVIWGPKWYWIQVFAPDRHPICFFLFMTTTIRSISCTKNVWKCVHVHSLFKKYIESEVIVSVVESFAIRSLMYVRTCSKK